MYAVPQKPISKIEIGDKFVGKRKLNIATVKYRSANGGVGYRIKFERRERYTDSVENFLRNWKPLNDTPDTECGKI